MTDQFKKKILSAVSECTPLKAVMVPKAASRICSNIGYAANDLKDFTLYFTETFLFDYSF